MEWVFYIEFELLYSVEYLLHYDLLFPVCNHMSFEVEGDLMFNVLQEIPSMMKKDVWCLVMIMATLKCLIYE